MTAWHEGTAWTNKLGFDQLNPCHFSKTKKTKAAVVDSTVYQHNKLSASFGHKLKKINQNCALVAGSPTRNSGLDMKSLPRSNLHVYTFMRASASKSQQWQCCAKPYKRKKASTFILDH